MVSDSVMFSMHCTIHVGIDCLSKQETSQESGGCLWIYPIHMGPVSTMGSPQVMKHGLCIHRGCRLNHLESGPVHLLAKIKIASVFRIITVHPDDRHLLGMKWNSAIYIDKQLLFGLRSPGRSPPFRHEME